MNDKTVGYRLTVTDYVVKADGVLEAKHSLREARLFVQELGKNKKMPRLVEVVKRTTTQTTMNIYRPKTVQTLIADVLDEGLTDEVAT